MSKGNGVDYRRRFFSNSEVWTALDAPPLDLVARW